MFTRTKTSRCSSTHSEHSQSVRHYVTAAVFVSRTWNAKTKVAKHNFSSPDILRVFTVISHNRFYSFNICTNIIVVEVKNWCSRPPISSSSPTFLKKTLHSLGDTKMNCPFNTRRVDPHAKCTVANITLCFHDSETMLHANKVTFHFVCLWRVKLSKKPVLRNFPWPWEIWVRDYKLHPPRFCCNIVVECIHVYCKRRDLAAFQSNNTFHCWKCTDQLRILQTLQDRYIRNTVDLSLT